MKVGQTIYLETVGNNARHGKQVIPVEVKEVKRKLFSVNVGCREYKFYIESLCQHTTEWAQTEYKAHLTPEQAEESAFRNDYETQIRNGLRKLNFNVIKTLAGIVKSNENGN